MSDEKPITSHGPTGRRGISRNLYILTIAVVAVIGFVAGTRSQQIIGTIGPVFGFKVSGDTLDLSSVQTTYQQLEANFDGTLDPAALIDGASRGLTAAAGDKYTVFMDADEADEFNDELTGDIGGGIGAEIGVRHDQPTIVRVLDDNPAKQAGLRAGDVLMSINGESTDHWTSSDAANKIRGEIGTTVKLTIQRDGKPMTFTITRATVNNPSVYSRIEDGTGILTISRFDDQTGELAQKAAANFQRHKVKRVVLDLRYNGGGYVTAAQSVASLWLKDKVIVTERSNGKVVDTLRSGNQPILAGLPTVVLVNGSTASASEIVAGALQDYGAARLVGEQTFGKGSVQKVINLAGGRILKVTVARWYTPDGKNIAKHGIAVDKTVEMTADDANADRDPQLQAALKLLQG